MFGGNDAEHKGVAKYKGLTTIATNDKPVGATKTNFKDDKLEDIHKDLLIIEYPN